MPLHLSHGRSARPTPAQEQCQPKLAGHAVDDQVCRWLAAGPIREGAGPSRCAGAAPDAGAMGDRREWRAATAAQPVRDALFDAPFIHMDETGVLKEKNKSPTSQSYMWVQTGEIFRILTRQFVCLTYWVCCRWCLASCRSFSLWLRYDFQPCAPRDAAR